MLTKQEEKVTVLQVKIQDQKADISERDEQITGKEKTIYEYKRKTQELDKFKYVLDFKIQELKREIAPRE